MKNKLYDNYNLEHLNYLSDLHNTIRISTSLKEISYKDMNIFNTEFQKKMEDYNINILREKPIIGVYGQIYNATDDKDDCKITYFDYISDDKKITIESKEKYILINYLNTISESTQVVGLLRYIDEIINNINLDKEDNRPKVHLLTFENSFFQTVSHSLNPIELDFQNDYEFNNPIDLEVLLGLFKQEKSGFFLFDGLAGTGKTTLIKYLSMQLPDIKFVFIPNSIARQLIEPNFIKFVINDLNNAVLILEDSEDILKSRDENGNQATSTILNITDGILGDISNMKIISTQNVTTNIDPALLRNGRLIKRLTFNKLPLEKIKPLVNRLDLDAEFTEATEIANIYNQDNGHRDNKSKIGFDV